MNLAGALAETILRNPQRRMVAASEIAARAATGLVCRRVLRVVTQHGPGLQMVGTNNAISTGPYNPCGLWSDALWDHANQPDGIAYRSRHDSSEICLALFERPGLELEVLQTRALAAMPREIGAMLDRYGKSLIPAPD